jgi:hypothetical protein
LRGLGKVFVELRLAGNKQRKTLEVALSGVIECFLGLQSSCPTGDGRPSRDCADGRKPSESLG